MLDEMALSGSKEQRSRGWWLLLRFLGHLSKSPRILMVATLESSRRKTFESLDIESRIGLPIRTRSAEVSAKEVELIAQNGFALGGLNLDDELLQEIQDKWSAFLEKRSDSDSNASPLPLACLWFAQLYQTYEDRAEISEKLDDRNSISQDMACLLYTSPSPRDS